MKIVLFWQSAGNLGAIACDVTVQHSGAQQFACCQTIRAVFGPRARETANDD
jgi:hypothetical protein